MAIFGRLRQSPAPPAPIYDVKEPSLFLFALRCARCGALKNIVNEAHLVVGRLPI
jgi:hypothetical protein